jgi:hypothetical protein
MSDLSSSASSIPPPLPPRPADGHPSNSNINAASSYMQQQPQFNQYPNTYGHYPYAAGAYGAGGSRLFFLDYNQPKDDNQSV